jgi:hypothetical protein
MTFCPEPRLPKFFGLSNIIRPLCCWRSKIYPDGRFNHYYQSLRISSRSPSQILQLTENENTAQIVALLSRIYHICEPYKKEMERLAIDLSWKSSQIEGNTYSLLSGYLTFVAERRILNSHEPLRPHRIHSHSAAIAKSGAGWRYGCPI